jgi:hypothetical protein
MTMPTRSANFEVLLLDNTGKTKKIVTKSTIEAAQLFINSWKKTKPNDDMIINCEFTKRTSG